MKPANFDTSFFGCFFIIPLERGNCKKNVHKAKIKPPVGAEKEKHNMETDRTSFNIDINRLMKVMSEIYSEMYGCKVTFTAVPKEVKP